MSDVEGFAARAAKLGYRLDDEQAAAVHTAVVADQDAALRLQKRSGRREPGSRARGPVGAGMGGER
ncbi:MAG: hypothetical protein QOI36_3306 [Pseudonocardiales bacterium]|jgi:hypothetical protein|nr:hypothetical protein [Pseudonocardia sp.]MDT7651900.1 hypothetical protein [Pseudonocardiales bacterium]